MGGTTEALKHVEEGEVEMVEIEHEARLHGKVDECDFIASRAVRSHAPCAKAWFGAELNDSLRRQAR